MKKKDTELHTTNYYDTLICVAEDYPSHRAKVPEPRNGKLTIAKRQYDLLVAHPYTYTSDDILFQLYIDQQGSQAKDSNEQRNCFFSKGRACFRASPLTKNYGWGVHFDHLGRMAIHPMESSEYQKMLKNASIKKIMAMRNARK
ncbi:MAG TPA: DUF6157 family protein [Arachidicoccus sp.]|nr:DUF6157 family protein [Arachidicoccus sp.]